MSRPAICSCLFSMVWSLSWFPLTAHAQSIPINPPALSEGAEFGYSVASIGDVTGDDIDDILIGAPYQDLTVTPTSNEGVAYVFDGVSGATLFTVTSPLPVVNGHFGFCVAAVPDVDGDGHSDLLVGAPDEGPSRNGRVHLFSSATNELLHTFSSPFPTANGHFGTAATGLPDMDGDGRGDVLVGAPYETSGSSGTTPGRAHVFSGDSGALLATLGSPSESRYGHFGNSVIAISDFGGDGFPDIAIGAPSEEDATGRYSVGRVHLFSGGKFTHFRSLFPVIPYSHGGFGKVISSVPDLDRDGREDLIVGAPDDQVGTAYVFTSSRGEPWLTLIEPYERGGSYFGSAVAGVRDIDGDGLGDLVVGSRRGNPFNYQEDTAGHVYAYSGGDGHLLSAVLSPGWQKTGRFGSSLAAVTHSPFADRPTVVVGAIQEGVTLWSAKSGRAYFVGFDCNQNGLPDAEETVADLAKDCNKNFTIDSCERDCNENLTPDECDIANGDSIDCNSNGYPDECDIANGLSGDCDGDGRADICEQDCNRNHVADECEIAAGTVDDCNHNGIPDRCDLDCNSNLIPDECESSQGLLPDCNQNGRPDSCDIQYYSSHDVNSNGMPDECEPDCNASGTPDYRDVRPSVDFRLVVKFDIGARPDELVSVDIDRDSDLDLLFSNRDSNRITIMLNDGSGRFTEEAELRTDRDPRAMVAKDLDGDGDDDLAVVTFYYSNVMVFLNNGEHPLSFAPPQRYPVGMGPIFLTAGDLDSDNDMDLVSVNMWGGTINVLKNDGAGSFLDTQTLEPHDRPVVAALADFDQDGDLDLAVSNSGSDDVSIFRNRGDVTFETPVNYSVGTWPIFMASADWNGDGLIDLAVGVDEGVSILTNQGNGLFARSALYSLSLIGYYMFEPMTVSAVDLDLDGDFDLAMAGREGPALGILWNRGNGTFEWGEGFGPQRLYEFGITGDFDGDGDADFAVNSPYYDRLLIFFNETIPSLVADCNVNGVPDSCEAEGHDCNVNGQIDSCDMAANLSLDCNENGTPDECELALADCNANGVPDDCDTSMYVKFVSGPRTYIDSYPWAMTVGDFDGDGDDDAIVLSFTDYGGNVRVLLNDSNGQLVETAVYPATYYAYFISSADFDNDGDLDVLVTGYDTPLMFLTNRGDGTFTAEERPALVAFSPVKTADVDRDGDMDLVMMDDAAGSIAISFNDGVGGFSSPTYFSVDTRYFVFGVGDVNGDGFCDVVVLESQLELAEIMINLGTDTSGAWRGLAPPMVVSEVPSPYDFILVDLNNDSDLDMAVLHVDSNPRVSMYLNDEKGVYELSSEVSLPNDPVFLAAGDLNNDKLPDLAAAIYVYADYYNSYYQTVVSIVMNRGNGFFSPRMDAPVGLNPIGVSIVDMNGDGWQDVVTANSDSLDLTVQFNQSSAPFSNDCNGNQVPDECESPEDCNGNGVRDICELAAGTATDCNGDGALDSCKACGDLTDDGACDGADFAAFLTAFGHGIKEPEYLSAADYDADGAIGLADYDVWLCCYRTVIGNLNAKPPQPANVGDMNLDGVLDGRDIRGFIEVLMTLPNADLPGRALADVYYDGELNTRDLTDLADRLVNATPVISNR